MLKKSGHIYPKVDAIVLSDIIPTAHSGAVGEGKRSR